jgi:hypothetical protein
MYLSPNDSPHHAGSNAIALLLSPPHNTNKGEAIAPNLQCGHRP